jgi:hypothetical protein
MLKQKYKAFSILYFVFGLIVFLPSAAYADCADPEAPKGGFAYLGSPDKAYHYCDGQNWIELKHQHALREPERVDVALKRYSDIARPEPAAPHALLRLQATTNAFMGDAE